MTTSGDSYDMPPTPEPLQPLLRSWLHQTGALSALPGAPVVADPPVRSPLLRRWLGRRRAGRLLATRAPADGAAAQPAAVPAGGC